MPLIALFFIFYISGFSILGYLFYDYVVAKKRILMRIELKSLIHSQLKEKEEKLQNILKECEDKISMFHLLFESIRRLNSILEDSQLLEQFKDELRNICSFSKILFLRHKDEILDGFTVFSIAGKQSLYKFVALQDLQCSNSYFTKVLIKEFAICLKRSELYRIVEELAIYDSLTGVFNRRHLLERLEDEFSRAKRFSLNVSLLMVDIDDFKKCNDTYGHLVGDVVLKRIVHFIKESIRSIDLVGRLGGEEFLVVLPETSKEDAMGVAQRILETVQKEEIRAYDENLKVTVSIGVSSSPSDAKELVILMEKADLAMYNAKRQGKDRVCER